LREIIMIATGLTANVSPANVLVIQPDSSGLSLLQTDIANEKGLIVLSKEEGELQVPLKYRSGIKLLEKVNTMNESEVEHAINRLLLRGIKIDTIIPGYEYVVEMAANLSDKLSIKGIGKHTAKSFRDKYEMKRVLREKGVSVSNNIFFAANEMQDIDTVLQKATGLSFPVVVKPNDLAVSTGVKKVDSLDQLRHYLKTVTLSTPDDLGKTPGGWLVEEYIDGEELSIEGFVVEGQLYFTSLTKKVLGPEPSFYEIGHIVSADNFKNHEPIIREYIEQVIYGLELPFGPFHAEIRLSSKGPQLIEVAARLGGDKIAEIVKLAGGSDHGQLMLNSYVGAHCKVTAVKETVGVLFLSRRLGETALHFSQEELPVSMDLLHLEWIQPENYIIEKAGIDSRVGYVIAKSENPQTLLENFNALSEWYEKQ